MVTILSSTDCGGRTSLDTIVSNRGGATSFGGAAGTGCTGNFETIQSGTGLCVAKMVTISAPSGYMNYSIDVTEVTKGQYDAWLATNPPLPANTDANCSTVVSYTEQDTNDKGGEDHPIVFVDWCDAYAYCKGVGKRLCGAIGGGMNDYNSLTLSQWYRACSSAGANDFPYGNTYQPKYCDDADYWNGNSANYQTVAVGALAKCATAAIGFAGTYDLSGNVWEWEDSCSASAFSDDCRIRGGSFKESGLSLICGAKVSSPRGSVAYDVGFRCCSQ